MLEYQNIFSKVYTPNWSEEDFVIIKVKNTVLWTYIISDLNGEEVVGTFYKNELQNIEKVIKGKSDLYAIWKGYNDMLNSRIDKKDTVYLSQYFLQQNSLGANVKVKFDLSNYATKTDLKKGI